MNDMTKPRRDLVAGLRAGMASEENALENRFRKAEALLGSATPYAASAGKRASGGLRAARFTFSMTSQDADLIERQLMRIAVETGMRLNKSELVRVGVMGLSKLTTEQLSEVCLGLNRLNKRT